MNLSAIPELLINWFRHQGAELLQAEPGQQRGAHAFKPGEQYEGQVLQNLANGRSLVKVGQETLDMRLPKEMQTGETVRLTYLSNAPRPTFMLTQAASAAAPPVRLSDAAQQVAALVRFAQSASPTPTTLTAPVAGRVAVPAGAAGVPPPAGAPPTVAAGRAEPGSMRGPAAVLQPGVMHAQAQPAPAPGGGVASGFAAGRAQGASAGQVPASSVSARPLIPNPQMLLASDTSPASVSAAVAGRAAIPAMAMAGPVEGMRATLASSSNLAAQGVTQAPLPDGNALPVRLKQVVQESGMFYEAHLSRWTRGEMSLESLRREPQAQFSRIDGAPQGAPELQGLSDDAARMAGRQLIILEGGPFYWQGQAWPGQQMEWLVEERAGEGAGGGDAGSQWHTELRLLLPRMGAVTAALDLSAQGLRVRLQASEPGALDEIRAALPDLMARMRDAQLNVQQLAAELAHAETEAAH